MKTRTALLAMLLMTAATHAQNQRDIAVRKDKQELSNDNAWLYDDLDSALEVAAETKRPLMIVFR
jgi:hypothetical protein